MGPCAHVIHTVVFTGGLRGPPPHAAMWGSRPTLYSCTDPHGLYISMGSHRVMGLWFQVRSEAQGSGGCARGTQQRKHAAGPAAGRSASASQIVSGYLDALDVRLREPSLAVCRPVGSFLVAIPQPFNFNPTISPGITSPLGDACWQLFESLTVAILKVSVCFYINVFQNFFGNF